MSNQKNTDNNSLRQYEIGDEVWFIQHGRACIGNVDGLKPNSNESDAEYVVEVCINENGDILELYPYEL